MAKRLIVNADDYNTDPERNRGIIEAVRRGIVTSTTVIANTPWQDASTAGLKSAFGDRVGVHINLTKGAPIVQGLSTLVDDEGRFFDKGAVWRKALLGLFSLREIETEFAAQITLLRERGIVRITSTGITTCMSSRGSPVWSRVLPGTSASPARGCRTNGSRARVSTSGGAPRKKPSSDASPNMPGVSLRPTA